MLERKIEKPAEPIDYISFAYQEWPLERFSLIMKYLKGYIAHGIELKADMADDLSLELKAVVEDFSFDCIRKEIKIGAINKDIAKLQLVCATLNEITLLQKKFDKERNQSRILLCDYFQSVFLRILEAKNILLQIGMQNCDLDQRMSEFQAHINKLQSRLDKSAALNCYEIRIPNDEYIQLDIHRFYYQGKARSAGKTAVGGLGMLGSLVGYLVTLPFVSFVGLTKDPEVFSEHWNAFKAPFKKSAAYAKNSVGGFGYSCRQNIPAAWVHSHVIFIKDAKGICTEMKNANPEYKTLESVITVLYVLDVREPEIVFKEGINYCLETGNSKGRTLLFNDPYNACHCASKSTKGKEYDPIAGWNIDHEWKKEDLDSVYNISSEITKRVRDTVRFFPVGIPKMIAEYATPIRKLVI